jgi:hypothetical protein
MLYTLCVVLLVFWLIGAVTYPMGGFIHMILVVVVILALLQYLKGRRILPA